MAADNIADRAAGFGMPGVIVDGFDFFAVYEVAGEAIKRALAGAFDRFAGDLVHREEIDPVDFLGRACRSRAARSRDVGGRPTASWSR